MQSRRCIIAALCLIWLNSATAIGADAVTRVDTYGDWSLLADTNAPHLFCFVTSEPKTSEPQDVPRDAPGPIFLRGRRTASEARSASAWELGSKRTRPARPP